MNIAVEIEHGADITPGVDIESGTCWRRKASQKTPRCPSR